MNLDPITWTRIALSGYLLTISIETPVLVLLLGKRYSLKEKLFAGVFLTGCSYPFVSVFFPMIWDPYTDYRTYVTVSEIFAPLSECIIFALLFQRRKELSARQRASDLAVVVAANLLSYLAGELMKACGFHFA